MTYFKSCPRCGGDLQEGSDRFGPYIACIKCGDHLTGKEGVMVASAQAEATLTKAERQRWRMH